jgi:hypothetical protein
MTTQPPLSLLDRRLLRLAEVRPPDRAGDPGGVDRRDGRSPLED